jgi:crotonobetainyl-CoA:carnitine CoA-transferase CaiB-like acyl-CoA transferase
MTRPLDGLKILDFTHVLAGPFATRLLGDMGADVVKVNSSTRSGPMATTHPHYLMWNRNKRALAIDMSKEESRPFCRQLCERADVVIDNFSVGVLERWGVGYDTVSPSNPGVIYVQMSGMGEGGPWSDFVTYAPTIHALSGLTHLTGVPGRSDIGIGFSYNDHQAGLHSAVAILSALDCRRRTGRGQRVDMSQFEVGVNFVGPALLDYFANDHAAGPVGNRMPYDPVAPHNCYPCAGAVSENVEDERWVAIVCMNDGQWQALRGVVGNPEWSRHAKYRTAESRVENVAELDAAIADWTRQMEATKVMTICQSAGVPAGVVQTGADMAERDPQLALQKFIRSTTDEHPELGAMTVDALPLKFHGTPCDEYKRVRAVGEDNAAVLQEWLGMTAEQVQKGEEEGIFT